MQRILVTPRSATRSGHPELDRLRGAGFEVVTCTPGVQPDEEELIGLLPGCVGYLAGVEAIGERALASANQLRAISRNGVGTDAIDLDAAKERGITVCTAPGANSQGVAELSVGLMLALARSLPAAAAAMKKGVWQRAKGVELAGRRLGVVGCGNIGRRVAAMSIGLGMHVSGYDLYPNDTFCPSGFSWESLENVLHCDVVSLHCPPSSEPLVDASAVASMRRGAWLVNTARADLVDEEAVIEALDSGRLGGYATDVYHEEPPANRRLVEHEQVIATPHIGGYTVEGVDNAMSRAVDNLINALSP